ncbi:hypothetical protein WR25_15145 [Diploscapter pachys]|uniref:Neurotransmitter-gated ion-channel ligand-binding domain-containing protein n=1 Tax=Diploscapter pachys TaxID=2018661 RepID=A0A2A2K461_9BILA|nr:hypothetical protein WR25_15145 [Diploscapter pachys]
MNVPKTFEHQSANYRCVASIIIILVGILIELGDADASTDTEIIKKLLGRGYDWRVRPPGINLTIPGTHGPVIVNVNMLIRSISKLDDVNMEYSVQMTFREEWVDGRLAFGLPNDNKPDFIILTAGQQIWMPDSFFQNEKQAQKHMIDKPNVLIRIHKDGRILYSVRISMVLSCPMYLHEYPMDQQLCEIQLASYAYTDKDIGAVPARVTLGVTTLLTMTTQSSGINAKLPPVSYTKAIDIWIGACLTFIFGALLEFAWVTYISSRSFYRSSRPAILKSKNSLMLATKQAMIIPNTNAAQFCDTSPDLRTKMEDDVWVRQDSLRFNVDAPNMEEGLQFSPREIRPLMGMTDIKRRIAEPADMIVLAPSRNRRSSQWSHRIRNHWLWRWISNKFDVEDRGKRADLVSSQFS